MSPFDISMLAIPISLPMAILPGPSCMDCIMVVVLAIFSEVHFIISAEAGTDRNAERAANMNILVMQNPFSAQTQ